ncbi:S-methyl-5-thioribose kinase [Macrococcoides caseolyticum]|uniref:S-methyl-5-thioribose kinase n=1 Tax=Macrococcoides caseolyticum TaxID=69966 RepID=UPI001F1AE752|nr:S-methyl-5-thioribose kinase [Macrococcus caseolyticus]MCE4957763.1 S-methyl-5-thioribose kinase [Macrococcus caseolyticus]
MSQFNTYFLMQETDIAAYILQTTDLFNANDTLTVDEIGDGNLNYVFRVSNGSKSIIVKHSGVVARISDEFKLSTDRTIREGKLLQVHGAIVPQLVPHIYAIDEVMKCVIMEDLKDYTVLRQGLIDGHIYPNIGVDLGTYLAETLINTSDFILSAKEKKALQKETINPELCEISEDLVFTEPFYNNNSRNEVSDALLPYVEQLLYNDETLKLAVAEAKLKFLNKSQSLIHGDLHSGSVFVNETETKMIDPEFGFYGPAGYDVGNVLAHLFFAYSNAQAHKRDEQAKFIAESITEVLEVFKQKSLELLQEKTKDVALKQSSVYASYIRSIIEDAYVVCGLELIRRIVGLAKVSDITTLPEDKRVQTEVQLIKFAKSLIQYPETVSIYPSIFSLYSEFKEIAA